MESFKLGDKVRIGTGYAEGREGRIRSFAKDGDGIITYRVTGFGQYYDTELELLGCADEGPVEIVSEGDGFRVGDKVEVRDPQGIYCGKATITYIRPGRGCGYEWSHGGGGYCEFSLLRKCSVEPSARAVSPSQERKNLPVASGCLDYFPAALLAVAALSKAGNDKHNPGQPMHHARGKSMDHADCLVRHLIERGTVDPETGLSHTVAVAWRALALLQEELEAAGASKARGAK